jgi:peptidoglycan hydrolase CwlO-like protein
MVCRFQSVQNQRDRFMKSVADKDQEILALKNKLDRMQEEQAQLKWSDETSHRVLIC